MLTPPLLAPLGMLDPAPHPSPLAETVATLFDRLGPLHCMRVSDRELLVRSATGLRFIRAMGAYSTFEHDLFGVALAELHQADACVVEATSCFAADRGLPDPNGLWSALGVEDHRRVLWFAAMLRLADGLVGERRGPVGEIYAAWTDATLYVEIDGVGALDDALDRARSRVAALEAVTGRRLVLTSATRRRGVA